MSRAFLLFVPLVVIGCTETNAPIAETRPTSATQERLVRARTMIDRDLAWARGVRSGAITVRPKTLGLDGENLSLFCSIVKTADAVIDTVKAVQDLREQKATPKDDRSPDELAREWPNTVVDGKDVRFVADEDAKTTPGASQAAVLDDDKSGILSIGYSVAKALGLGIDEMCGGSESGSSSTDDTFTYGQSEATTFDKSCSPFEEGACKTRGGLCAYNGGPEVFCCRAPVTSGTKCFYGVDNTCPPGQVCSNSSNDWGADWFCTKPEVCR